MLPVRVSRNDGLTWDKVYAVSGVPAAYSDLVRLDATTVGLLYETGNFSAYETITFHGIPTSTLTTS